MRPNLPFIPAWLDDAGLSASTFRVYTHLCRSANNDTGLAWPSYLRMTKVCGLGKTTVRRCLEELESIGLIAKEGKPFGGSCRYRVYSIVPPQGQMDESNGSTTGTIEAAPIVPPQDRNSPSDGTSIVPPQGQEGSPKKVLQRRKHQSENSEESPARKSAPTESVLPFASEAFFEAWGDWQQHRKEKKKPITPLSAKKQLNELESWGEARAIAAINLSISKGWQGIFEGNASAVSTKTPTRTRELLAADLGL